MERRDLLGTLGAIGAIGIAGCSENANPGPGDDDGGGADGNSDDGNNDDGNNDDGNSGDGTSNDGGGDGDSGDGGDSETNTENDASLYIAQAVSTLNAVAIRLNKTQEKLDTPEEIELDEQKLLDGIEDARGQLDSATDSATDTQRDQIETLRNLATVLGEITRVIATVRDVEPQAVAEDTKNALNDENYETALSLIRDGNQKAKASRKRTRNATDALRGVDPDRLAEVDGVEYAKVEEAVTKTHGFAKAFVKITAGYESTILGAQDLEAGRDDIETKDWAAAKTDFGNANAHFASAQETLDAVAEDAPDSITGRIGTAECQTRHLKNASEHFENAAGAADDGNLAESKEERQAGETDYNEVDDCS